MRLEVLSRTPSPKQGSGALRKSRWKFVYREGNYAPFQGENLLLFTGFLKELEDYDSVVFQFLSLPKAVMGDNIDMVLDFCVTNVPNPHCLRKSVRQGNHSEKFVICLTPKAEAFSLSVKHPEFVPQKTWAFKLANSLM